ncbi:MAG: GEVED domain-containing protein [Bacteroidia bacterium]
MYLGVSATTPNDIYAGSLSHYKTTDGGATWNMFADWTNFFGSNYMHADMRVFRTWGNRIYAGTDGFLSYSSDNGQTWSIIGQGVSVREFYRIGCSAMDAGTVVGGSQDNGTSVMREGAWHEWIGADGMQAHVDYNNPGIWFGTIQFGNLQRTLTAGQDAADVSAGTNGAWITPSVIDPNNENTLFIAYDDVYKSVDNGDHWQQLVNFNSGNFDEIAISPSDSNYLYISQGSAIRRSTNNGANWTFVNAGLPSQFINRIAVHPDDPQHVVVCLSGFSSGNKVFASTNGGSNWTNLSGNLPNLPANALAWVEGSPAKMILGMDVGVYYADAGSNAWTLYADSLPALVVNDLEVLNGAGLIRAGTWGRGLWEAPIPGRVGMPQILQVIADPAATVTRPKPADSVEVTAIIVNAGGIQSANLRWGTSPATQPSLLSMAHIAGDSFRATIPAQPGGTRVYYRITAFAPNGDSVRTERLMYRVKPAILCAASGAQGTTFDFIDTVAVASLNNASGQDYYGDFRNLFTDMYRDSSYTIMTSLNYHFPLDTMYVWIDWNHDGEVLQPGEQIIMSDFDGGHNSYGSFTVPHVPSVPDTVTMRVRCIYGANATADPCGDIFGEVEDYSIVLRDPVLIGMEDVAETELTLAPNPARQNVTVRWRSNVEEATVSIMDMQGRRILTSSMRNGMTTFDLDRVAGGFYLVELRTPTLVKRARLVVGK